MVVVQEMEKLKSNVNEFMDSHKKKSNSYWQKIKDALSKINSKIHSNQKNLIDLQAKLEHFQEQRLKDK